MNRPLQWSSTLSDNATVTLPGQEPVAVQHRTLTGQEATLLADYKRWLHARKLTQELFCPVCRETRTAPIEIAYAEGGEIGLICPHRLTVSAGPPTASLRPVDISNVKQLVVTLGPRSPLDDATVRLSFGEAALLRAYGSFLRLHGWLEALRCQNCDDVGYRNGCKAVVTDSAIDIQCRHRHLLYRGSTD